MNLILVGFGTVGRGVVDCLVAAAGDLADAGVEARVVAVIDPAVGSVAKADGLDLGELLRLADSGGSLGDHPGATSVESLRQVLESTPAEVLVELTPTNLQTAQPGLGHIEEALDAGLHVITTNKGPIALKYGELTEKAAEAGVSLLFEGTVMSGAPVLNLCSTGLAGAGIRGIRGVLNGTCNFILCEMEAGRSYAEALADAQQKGYAEADPSGDVDGWDAAAKAVILANGVLGGDLSINDVERTGISAITAADVDQAAAAGKVWRLVARVEAADGGWRASIAPEQVDKSDVLGSLRGPGNLLVFDTEALGEVSISGPGAGRRATGHAVVADLLAIHRRHGR